MRAMCHARERGMHGIGRSAVGGGKVGWDRMGKIVREDGMGIRWKW